MPHCIARVYNRSNARRSLYLSNDVGICFVNMLQTSLIAFDLRSRGVVQDAVD